MAALIALDIDGTLIDTRASFTRIVRELSGADEAEIWRFRDTGHFNDDWELTRAARAWVDAGRPDIFHALSGLHEALARTGHDPGDLSAACSALYRGGYWKDEQPLVDATVLSRLSSRHRVGACTGRDRWELARAEELLGFRFPAFTTMEDVKKPEPRALLRLCRGDEHTLLLCGDTEADRLCAENARALTPARVCFAHARETRPVAPLLRALCETEGSDVDALVARWSSAEHASSGK